MVEVIPENNGTLNCKVKQALIELGIKPDPTLLYSLQLMHWILWNHRS